LFQVFRDHEFEAVLHFAGLKAVGESVTQPGLYYDNNINRTLKLLECMQIAEVKTLVFSSSATVYSAPDGMPITEDFPAAAINPYGRSKLFIEEILKDQFAADSSWRISLLRYFNPVGAHASGEIGEHPNGIPNNLVPYISQVALGKHPYLCVFGNDYPTPDGTGIRDYIHVMDLVHGHLKAMEFLDVALKLAVHNLGTGNGHSVMEVLRAFETVSGKSIPFKVVDRRPGDAVQSYANPQRSHENVPGRLALAGQTPKRLPLSRS
jgi:UDP-glucose 4-epimerase